MKKIKTTRQGQRGKESQRAQCRSTRHFSPNPTEKDAEYVEGPLNVVPHDIPTLKPTELDAEESRTAPNVVPHDISREGQSVLHDFLTGNL